MLSEPILFKLEDKEYKVHQLTQELIDKFQKYVEYEELQIIRSSKDLLNDDEYTALIKDYLFAVKNNRYAWGSNESIKYLQTDEGTVNILSECFKKHQTITRTEVKKMYDEHSEAMLELYCQILQSKKNEQ